MPTVDDLVISLRIDETSNLGKLHKQLTTLVGPKGDKPIRLGMGIGVSIRSDIDFIKGKMELLTHISPGVDTEKLKLSATALYKQLKDPMISKNVINKLGQNEEWLRDIQEILAGIVAGTTQMKATKIGNLLPLLDTMIKKSPAQIGNILQMVTNINNAIDEVVRQKQIQDIFREFDDSVREFSVGMSKPVKEIEEILKSDKGLRKFLEEERLKPGGTLKIDNLIKQIKNIKDPLQVMELFAKYDLRELTKLPDDLKPLAAAYIEVMKTEQISLVGIIREFLQGKKTGGVGLTQNLGRGMVDFLTTSDVIQDMIDRFKGKGLEIKGGVEDLPPNIYAAVEYEKTLQSTTYKEISGKLEKFKHLFVIISKHNKLSDKYIDLLDKQAKSLGHTYTLIEMELRKVREELDIAPSVGDMGDLIDRISKEKARIIIQSKQQERFYTAMEKLSTDDPRASMIAALELIEGLRSAPNMKDMIDKALHDSNIWREILKINPTLYYQTLEAILKNIEGNGEDLEDIKKSIISKKRPPINELPQEEVDED